MKIILIVGPSGSGKDSLLRSARKSFADNPEVFFSKRYITRPPDTNELNFYIDENCFHHLKTTNYFITTWNAHNNYYGLPHTIFSQTNAYKTVVCSISRDAVKDFEQHFEPTTILVTTPSEILRQRLSGRGRENSEEIEKRLKRAEKSFSARNLVVFDNSDDLETSCRSFRNILLDIHLGRFEASASKN